MTTAADAERIARRYPPRRVPRWAWIPVASALAAVGTVWLVWSGWYAANPPVAAHVSGFKVVSDTRIDVTVTVQRPDPAKAARCEVKVQAVSYDTVGQLPFDVPPSASVLVDQTVEVRTFKRATAAEVTGCRLLPGP